MKSSPQVSANPSSSSGPLPSSAITAALILQSLKQKQRGSDEKPLLEKSILTFHNIAVDVVVGAGCLCVGVVIVGIGVIVVVPLYSCSYRCLSH